MFEPYLASWQLTADGAPFSTHSSHLLPVRSAGGAPAMIKMAFEPEERFGAALMVWWAGEGAARVLAHEDGVLLLERATGRGCLEAMARNGQDDEATRIFCRTATALHAPRACPPPELIPLDHWFRQLEPGAARYGGVFVAAAKVARDLLAEPRDQAVLHGDLHHGNVLDFAERGWLAIDPKRLVGERGFDFANILLNPETDRNVVLAPGRFERQVSVIAGAAGLERERLIRWVLAYAGLSAVWRLDDHQDVLHDMAISEIAAAVLQL